MTICPILKLGDTRLLDTSPHVGDINARQTQNIIQDLLDTLKNTPAGAGLAAPQIGHMQRIILYHIPRERITQEKNAQTIPYTILINPLYMPKKAETTLGLEGCLSLPNIRAVVPRYEHILYTAQTPTGETIQGEASGFHARVIQHECDHLDGILILKRIDSLRHIGFTQEMHKRYDSTKEHAIRTDTAGSIHET
ncbi:MAG: peptide deformylase [Alphaproteobacteria bacterium GM7ARS4]|nr:peptide deformylase [Alphaproteobacteria bacterium GM7ARS4]